jgi:hypothetical protein
MSLTIQLPLTTEQYLRENAARDGISLESYITQLLTVKSKKKEKKRVFSEDELLMRIQLNIQPSDLEEFYRLTSMLKFNTISESDREKLIQLNDLIEIAHAERMKYVVELSKIRNETLEKTMEGLGIKPLAL